MRPSSITSALAAQFSVFSILRYRDFRLYFSGLSIQVAGHMMMLFTLGWLAFELTGSPLRLGAVFLMMAIPSVILGVVGGALADRFDQRRIITSVQLLSALIVSGLAVLVLTGRVEFWHLLVVSFLVGAVQALDQASRQSLFPRLLPDRSLIVSGVSLYNVAFHMNRTMATAIAGFVIASTGGGSIKGAGVAFAISAAAFIGMAILAQMIRARREAPAHPVPMLQNLREGGTYIRGHALFKAIIAMTYFNGVFGLSYLFLLPVFAGDVFDVGAVKLGFLSSGAGFGALVAVVIVGPRLAGSRAMGRVLPLTMMAFGVTLMAFSASPWYYLALVLTPLVGLSSMTFMASIEFTIQSLVPNELRGRVMGVHGIVWHLIPLGAFLLSFVASFTSIQWAVGGGALLLVLFGLAVGALNPAVRSLGVVTREVPVPQGAATAKAEG